MTNIITNVPSNPNKHVCQVKYLNNGLKLGAPVNSMPKQAKFVAKYDNINRTELIWAIVFKDPINSTHSTKIQLVTTAAMGFPFQVPRTIKFNAGPKT